MLVFQACTLARRNAEVFLKYIHRNNVSTPGAAGHTRGPEQQVKGERRPGEENFLMERIWSKLGSPSCCSCAAILNELLQRENRVLHFWTLKKRRLDQCQQYLVFERSAKQVRVCAGGCVNACCTCVCLQVCARA